MTERQLVSVAQNMRERAYAPYSGFAVGAALECSDGTVFTGCNVENAAYGSTLCAERVALAKAVSEGHRDFERIAVAAGGEEYCVPCGGCRQVLREFAQEITVLCARGDGEYVRYQLEELLPHGFGPEFLK